ncbi:MAG: aspartate kinase, partial [Myxococcales bacterium]|nr:aspartate kinase [Myxococcales bacterium]
MSLIVQKFGGTSVGSVDRIRNVARRVAETRLKGHDVIVVVSAMSGETDRLLKLGKELSPRAESREMDVLVATGETVTSALLAIALNQMGVPARSLQAHQAKILTDDVHTKARIKSIDGSKISEALGAGKVVVVPGFQGVDAHGNVTTLGRGGSDTSAV